MADPKLVELLAAWGCYSRWHDGDRPCGECREDARDFIDTHRVVQLPERPNGVAGEIEVEARFVGYDRGGYPEWEPEPVFQHFVGQVRGMPKEGTLVYIIPGDPQEVEP